MVKIMFAAGMDDLLGSGTSANSIQSKANNGSVIKNHTPDPFGILEQTTKAVAHEDPFSVFQTPAKPHVQVAATHTGHDDLLGGFEGSLGIYPWLQVVMIRAIRVRQLAPPRIPKKQTQTMCLFLCETP